MPEMMEKIIDMLGKIKGFLFISSVAKSNTRKYSYFLVGILKKKKRHMSIMGDVTNVKFQSN